MKRFRLNEWVIDPSTCRMVSDRERRTLQAREMEVLLSLVEAAGEVVSKDSLMRDVWGDRAVVDHVLPKTVSGLRRAFGETARDARIIETLPKRGYRLGCPVVGAVEPVRLGEPGRSLLSRAMRAAVILAWIVVPPLVGLQLRDEPPPTQILVDEAGLPFKIEVRTGFEEDVVSAGDSRFDAAGSDGLAPRASDGPVDG